MFKIIQQPFPRENNFSRSFRTAWITGLLVAVFLRVFRPFDLSNVPVAHPDLFIFGYGIVTALVVMIAGLLPYIFPVYFDEDKWTVGKNVLLYMFVIFFIGVGNMLYTHFSAGMPLGWNSFLVFQVYTICVSFVIAALFTFFKYSGSLKMNLAEAKVLDSEIHRIHEPSDQEMLSLQGEGEKEMLSLKTDLLLFIEAADNYSNIYFIEKDAVRHQLLRGSLKRMEEQIRSPHIFRCHRSYIVNLRQVRSVSGNSQGYRLHFSQTDRTIPVARRTGPELHERLKDA